MLELGKLTLVELRCIPFLWGKLYSLVGAICGGRGLFDAWLIASFILIGYYSFARNIGGFLQK